MFKVKVLNHEVLDQVLDMKKVIDIVEDVYVLKAENKTELFPMVFHEFNPGVADMDIKSGHLKDVDIFGLKLVSWYGENKEKNLPLLIGTTMIFDSKTGKPLAILNADHITGMRTGAAGAIGAKYMANKDSKTMLMIGTGHVAKFEIAATLIAMDSLETVRVYDPMSFESSEKYSEKIKGILEAEFLSKYKDHKDYEELKTKFDVKFEAVKDIEEAVKSSDVIITATPSRKPLIKVEWITEGTHISCVGSDMEGKQEIDENIFKTAKIIVDDVNQAVNVGETETPIKKNIITEKDIIGEIGEVIKGTKKARTSSSDITIFDTTGIAIQDLITSKLALDIAEEKNLGITIDL